MAKTPLKKKVQTGADLASAVKKTRDEARRQEQEKFAQPDHGKQPNQAPQRVTGHTLFGSSVLSSSPIDQVAQELKDSFNAILAKAGNDAAHISVQILSNRTAHVSCNMLIICAKHGHHSVYQPLLIQPASHKRGFNDDGLPVVLWDQVTKGNVQGVVSGWMLREKGDISPVLVTPIFVPNTYSVEATADAGRRLLSCSANAVNRQLMDLIDPNYRKVSATAIKQDTPTTTLKTFWGNEDIESAVGVPVRSDVTNELWHETADEVICSTHGYMDLAYTYDDTRNKFGVQGLQAPNYTYAPAYTITSLGLNDNASLAYQLLALSTAMVHRTNWSWLPAFSVENARPLQDVSVLGLESNFGQATVPGVITDTTDPEWWIRVFPGYMSSAVSADCSVALDIEINGTTSWIDGVFMDAATASTVVPEGSPEGTLAPAAVAVQKIICAANELTDNHFGVVYERMCREAGHSSLNPTVRQEVGAHDVHAVGTYPGEDGTPVDIRRFDRLAALNLWGQDALAKYEQYSNTFNVASGSEEQRLKLRTALQSEALGGKETIHGYCIRVECQNVFLAALEESLRLAGIVTNTTDTINVSGARQVYTQQAPVHGLGMFEQRNYGNTGGGYYDVGITTNRMV